MVHVCVKDLCMADSVVDCFKVLYHSVKIRFIRSLCSTPCSEYSCKTLPNLLIFHKSFSVRKFSSVQFVYLYAHLHGQLLRSFKFSLIFGLFVTVISI